VDVSKKLILYAYFESPIASKNLSFFLERGLTKDSAYTFIFIINGHKCSVPIPSRSNIRTIRRDNYGFDFGAWGEGLTLVDINEYTHFIFINSTCVGPFLPRYSSLLWADLFVSSISSEYKLCGPTINYLRHNPISEVPHIQSFAFGTDCTGLKILLENNIFSPSKDIDKNNLVIKHEIQASKVILDKGYKLFAFQLSESMPKNTSIPHDDIHYNGAYYEDTLNPLEIMFIKSNRIDTITLTNYIMFLRKYYAH
jgi:lipopolysaccharide biosynthesis protein